MHSNKDATFHITVRTWRTEIRAEDGRRILSLQGYCAQTDFPSPANGADFVDVQVESGEGSAEARLSLVGDPDDRAVQAAGYRARADSINAHLQVRLPTPSIELLFEQLEKRSDGLDVELLVGPVLTPLSVKDHEGKWQWAWDESKAVKFYELVQIDHVLSVVSIRFGREAGRDEETPATEPDRGAQVAQMISGLSAEVAKLRSTVAGLSTPLVYILVVLVLSVAFGWFRRS